MFTCLKSGKCYFVVYPKILGIPHCTIAKCLPLRLMCFRTKCFFQKTVQLDEIRESESSDQMKQMYEVVPKVSH